MTDRDEHVQRIADDVRALVEPRQHREPFWTWTPGRHKKLHTWPTDQASLLDQLRAQVPPGGAESDGPGGPGAMESAPPLVVDALDRLMAIEAGSARVLSVELAQDLRDTVEGNLRAIVGQVTTLLLASDVRRVADEVTRWHGWAATLTGWRSPPWVPHVPCPICGVTGSLRVNLVGKRATCMACAEVWQADDGSIGLLADYIRGSDPGQAQVWEAGCDHSWRLTTVGRDGVRGRCVACHGTDVRRAWPKGTPVWTDHDGRMQGASA